MKKYLTIVFDEYGDMLSHEIIEAEDQADAERLAEKPPKECFGFVIYDLTPVYAVAREGDKHTGKQCFFWRNNGEEKWGTMTDNAFDLDGLKKFPDHRFANVIEILNK